MFLKQNSQLSSSVQGKQLSIQNEDETTSFHWTESVSKSFHRNSV